MTQLILEALAIEKSEDTPWKHTFKMYNYNGSMIDLFAIVEHLCLKRGLISEKKITVNGVEQTARIHESAWGCGWYNVDPDTSFNSSEQNIFFERFHYLISQQVISPGWVRNSAELPFFHVTDYGRKCLEKRDLLPYDTDGYIDRIQNCSQHDIWDVYYLQQVLKCFNHGLYDAATMMLGIEGEFLAGRLIEKYRDFLDKNEPTEKTVFDSALSSAGDKISRKYKEYSDSWRRIAGNKDAAGNELYPNLKAMKSKMDLPADATFMTYLRQTRNELGHPSGTVMEPSETMLLIVSFLKYFEIQNDFLDFYVQNS